MRTCGLNVNTDKSSCVCVRTCVRVKVSLSLRMDGCVSLQCAISIGYRILVSVMNSACVIDIRHATLPGDDVTMCNVSNKSLPEGVSAPLDCHHVTNNHYFTWWCGSCFLRHCRHLVTMSGCEIRPVWSSRTSSFGARTSKSNPFYIVKHSGIIVYNDRWYRGPCILSPGGTHML